MNNRRGGLRSGVVWLVVMVAIPAIARSGEASRATARPDAVIELWEQRWSLQDDGATTYHEKKHVRLNNERSYGEFADPRITYDIETEQLEIVEARVQRADGTCRELPEYSYVSVSPGATQGWPAFASIRQQLLVMSGIEPGCLVKLEYKIATKPGVRPCLAADVRLDHHYPVLARTVAVRTPAKSNVRYAVSGLPAGQSEKPAPGDAGALVWTFHDLPPVVDEPLSPPWQANCARLTFSTAGAGGDWVKARLAEIEQAADRSEYIDKLAAEWTKDQQEPGDKLRAIQEKLAERFAFVEFDPAWRTAAVRPASQVAECNYGVPEEAAAVLLALSRAAHVEAEPGLLVADEIWRSDIPQDTLVAAYVVRVADGDEVWEARRGRVLGRGCWAGYHLLADNGADAALPRPRSVDSRLALTGKVSIKDDGNYTGEIGMRTTGLFVSPDSLRAADAQKSRITALLGRLLPDVQIESVTVKMLADHEFEVGVKVNSGKVLKKVAGCWQFVLGQEPPVLLDVPLPLTSNPRVRPVRVTGRCDEQIALTVEWPEKWVVELQPSELPQSADEWTAVSQTAQRDGHQLKLSRHVRVAAREASQAATGPFDIPPAAFGNLCAGLNELRSEHCRTLLLKP